MDSVGRRRFLVIAAGAVGAGAVWWARRAPVPEVEAALQEGSSTSAARTAVTTTTLSSAVESTTSTSPPDRSTTTNASTTTTAPQEPTTTTSTSDASTTTVATTNSAAALNGSILEVIPRSAWGAAAAGAFTAHTIERITFHHSAVAFLDNRLGPARFRQHQGYHQDLGWPDIAYHLMIDRAGNVFEGRPMDAVGDTGTNYDPTGHFLPMCEGNFDEHDPSGAQLDALGAVIGWARTRFGTDVVGLHRDYASTSCPGDRLAARHGDVVSASDQYLGVSLRVLSVEEGAARVAAIETG